jgi:hypothetical protein
MNANPADTKPALHIISSQPSLSPLSLLDLGICFCLKPLKHRMLLREPFLESPFVLLGALRIGRRRLSHDRRDLWYEEPLPRLDIPVQPSVFNIIPLIFHSAPVKA